MVGGGFNVRVCAHGGKIVDMIKEELFSQWILICKRAEEREIVLVNVWPVKTVYRQYKNTKQNSHS